MPPSLPRPKLHTCSNATTRACIIGNGEGGGKSLICKNFVFLLVSVTLAPLSNLQSSLPPLILFRHVLKFLAAV